MREARVSVEHVGEVVEPQFSVVAPRRDAEEESVVLPIGLEGAGSLAAVAGCRGGVGGVKYFNRDLHAVLLQHVLHPKHRLSSRNAILWLLGEEVGKVGGRHLDQGKETSIYDIRSGWWGESR